MSASMMKTSTRQAASARPGASAKHCVVPSALMGSVLRGAISPAHSPSCPCCSKRTCARPSTVTSAIMTDVAVVSKEYDLKWRQESVAQHFPTAITVDDFIARVETVLSGYGFTGENSIAMTNLCRDEVTVLLKDKIESAFGASFNTNGLGGVLTCGVTGMGAGLSHSPACVAGRERYVFFSFPHIGIDGAGNVGSISRPGRSGRSCACGALQKCLNEFRAEGYAPNCRVPGVHDPLDPEYSILKQRLARRLRYERQDTSQLTLASLTGVAERTITNDLEYLIEKSVDPKKADYAIVTGIQIHNWATNLNGDAPSMEFVAPTKVMVCVDGQKIHLDLTKVPSLSPRQLALLAAGSITPEEMPRSSGPITEVPYDYMAKRLGGAKSAPGGGAAVAPVAATTSTIAPQYRAFQTTVEQPAYNISEENFSETFQAPSRVPALAAAVAAAAAVVDESAHPSFEMPAEVPAIDAAMTETETAHPSFDMPAEEGEMPAINAAQAEAEVPAIDAAMTETETAHPSFDMPAEEGEMPTINAAQAEAEVPAIDAAMTETETAHPSFDMPAEEAEVAQPVAAKEPETITFSFEKTDVVEETAHPSFDMPAEDEIAVVASPAPEPVLASAVDIEALEKALAQETVEHPAMAEAPATPKQEANTSAEGKKAFWPFK